MHNNTHTHTHALSFYPFLPLTLSNREQLKHPPIRVRVILNNLSILSFEPETRPLPMSALTSFFVVFSFCFCFCMHQPISCLNCNGCNSWNNCLLWKTLYFDNTGENLLQQRPSSSFKIICHLVRFDQICFEGDLSLARAMLVCKFWLRQEPTSCFRWSKLALKRRL